MKTLAETKKKPFNWNAFLNKKKYTEIELKNATRLSEDWVTCACGNQCALIPRDSLGSPLDKKLSGLGLLFNSSIYRMYYNWLNSTEKNFNKVKGNAIETLIEIEERSQFLINEEFLKLKKSAKEFGYNLVKK